MHLLKPANFLHPRAFPKLLFVIFLQFSFASNFAFADEVDAARQDIQAKQAIESERIDFIRQKEFREIEKSNGLKDAAPKAEVAVEFLKNDYCKTITDFEFEGNSKFSSEFLNERFVKPVLHEAVNSCLKKSDFLEIYNQIQNFYIEKGFVLARIYFDFSRANEFVIKIVVEEGKIEEVTLKDNSKLNEFLPWRRSAKRATAFPFLGEGDIVYLRDIEQGIDQINRLSSQNAKSSFEAAEKQGYSNLVVENNIGNSANLSFALDNSGNKRTGLMKRKVALNYDNLIGINDNFYLNYSESNAAGFFGASDNFNKKIGASDNSKNRFSKAFYSAFSMPLGYYSLGASYSYSHYSLTTRGLAGALRSSGNSEAKSYFLEKVLSRAKRYKISAKAELEQNDTDSYVENTYIPVNSRKTTQVNFSLNNIFYLDNGSLVLTPKYSKGLKILGAMNDGKNLAPDKPRAQFESFGFYGQSSLNFNIPQINLPINHKLAVDGFYSKDSLYGVDQFILGGRYSLRGFQQNIISGDSGYSIRNDVSVRLFDLMPQGFKQSGAANFAVRDISLNSLISQMRVGVFYDYGFVRNNTKIHLYIYHKTI